MISLSFSFPNSYANEPAMITFSSSMKFIEFDGKWSFFTEWKESSLNSIGDSVKIRSAHFENFVYIFVDVLNDYTLDKGSDRAMICFEPNNSKSILPDDEDYCFLAVLDREIGFTLQGDSPFSFKSNFKKIPNHPDYVAIGSISDMNDRYSKTPHPSYEFKIPTDIIQRTNYYGFYVETFDASSGQSLTWPSGISKNHSMHIPSPSNWGELISIDKSLPEFPLPLLLFVILVLSMIIMSKKLNSSRLTINNL